jgi:hypothetical protein
MILGKDLRGERCDKLREPNQEGCERGSAIWVVEHLEKAYSGRKVMWLRGFLSEGAQSYF